MKEEIQTLKNNHTWSIVSLLPGKTPIGCKQVYNIKYKASGVVERFKARFVAKGYNKKEGIDCTKAFSSMAKLVTVPALLALVAIFTGLHLKWMYTMPFYKVNWQPGGKQNMQAAKVYIWFKQESRQWNMKLTVALLAAGF